MLPEGIEHRMIWIGPVTTGLQIILYSDKGLRFQWDASELLALADHVDDCLVPVGLEIPNLQPTDFGFPESSGE